MAREKKMGAVVVIEENLYGDFTKIRLFKSQDVDADYRKMKKLAERGVLTAGFDDFEAQFLHWRVVGKVGEVFRFPHAVIYGVHETEQFFARVKAFELDVKKSLRGKTSENYSAVKKRLLA